MSFNGDEDELPEFDWAGLFKKIWMWNGDPPAPQITHWTPLGRISLVAATPRKTCSVQWNGKHIGYDDINPMFAVANFAAGRYDKDFGFSVSEIAPKNLKDWNNL